MTSWRPPASQARRDELAVGYARDGYALLEAVYDAAAPAWLRELPAIDVLRRVLLQNYTRAITGGKGGGQAAGEGTGRRRSPAEVMPGSPPRMTPMPGAAPSGSSTGWAASCISPRPAMMPRPAAAARQPRAAPRRGCAHLVFPNLITGVATTDATVTDNQMTAVIHDGLAAKNLAPGRHYTDSGYLSAALVVSELARPGIVLTGPLLAGTSAQARAGHGYARAGFAIDYDTRTATCPQGKTAATWTPCTQRGQATIVATFAASDCGPCPARALCTKSRRRQISLLPRALAEAQAAACAAEKATPYQAGYARRAGVEGAMH